MATKRKRKTKHRGNAAGMVESRGRTGRPVASPAKGKGKAGRDGRAAARANRFDQPPTWRGATIRAGVAAMLFFILVLLVFQQPLASTVALGAFVFLFYIPLGFFTDQFLYRRRIARKAAGKA